MPFDLGLIVGVFFVSIVPIVLLFLVVRGRGDVVRVWCRNVVPYFRRMKWNKPLRLKVRRDDVGQTLNKEIVAWFDSVIFKTISGALNFEQKADGVPDSLFKSWKVIRLHPEHYTVWGTFSKRKWYWEGMSGRWVYFYHLFPLGEMTLRWGRHQVVRCVLLPKPFAVHTAPTKEQWVDSRLREDLAKGIKPDDKHIRGYVKDWRKQTREKWLNTILYPTITVSEEAQIQERIQGLGTVISTFAYLASEVGEKLANYDWMKAYTDGIINRDKKVKDQFQIVADTVGEQSTIINEQTIALKELHPETIISPDAPPRPRLLTQRPIEKPSKLRAQLPENWVSYFLLFLGFASLLWGSLTSGAVQLVVGAFLLGLGAFMLWREGKRLKVSETIKESISEQKESALEQGA